LLRRDKGVDMEEARGKEIKTCLMEEQMGKELRRKDEKEINISKRKWKERLKERAVSKADLGG